MFDPGNDGLDVGREERGAVDDLAKRVERRGDLGRDGRGDRALHGDKARDGVDGARRSLGRLGAAARLTVSS